MGDHLNRYIGSQRDNIHKLTAKDTTGRMAYYLVLVPPSRTRAFERALGDGNGTIDLETYGRVIGSCYGSEPTQELRDDVKMQYGFDL